MDRNIEFGFFLPPDGFKKMSPLSWLTMLPNGENKTWFIVYLDCIKISANLVISLEQSIFSVPTKPASLMRFFAEVKKNILQCNQMTIQRLLFKNLPTKLGLITDLVLDLKICSSKSLPIKNAHPLPLLIKPLYNF